MSLPENYISNYDKFPVIRVEANAGQCLEGWKPIGQRIKDSLQPNKKAIVVVECYTGVHEREVLENLVDWIQPDQVISSAEAMKPEKEIDELVYPDVTDDEVFGRMTRLTLRDFFDADKLRTRSEDIANSSTAITLVYGPGASLLAAADVFIYADMPRWEGQLRYRRNEVSNLGVANRELKASLQYKRAYFVDWRVCDEHKKETFINWDFVLDTTVPGRPKMVEAPLYFEALEKAARRPFRLVPFFDPGPWGGQWMKEVCDLDKDTPNFAWCFDCVPEENSLLLRFGEVVFETPAINLVFREPEKLLGHRVFEEFGAEFPIRFDFLDTMGGGNLSLQVHPTKSYAREKFGIAYTQEESYYMLDTEPHAGVYLGFKDDIDRDAMIRELQEAKSSGNFDAEKYAASWRVKKHDHVLIPPGTIHCSGKGSMVLEISATPYIFTFKLWDWGRLGLDGKPRPINVEHGDQVLNWNLTPEKTEKELINNVREVASGDGWKEESTGLHSSEFIATRRHWFSKKVSHDTEGNLNVLNLVEGREVLVESPDHRFEPFIVHYAETFVVPAAVGRYTITPHGEAAGTTCATMKAFVKDQQSII